MPQKCYNLKRLYLLLLQILSKRCIYIGLISSFSGDQYLNDSNVDSNKPDLKVTFPYSV